MVLLYSQTMGRGEGGSSILYGATGPRASAVAEAAGWEAVQLEDLGSARTSMIGEPSQTWTVQSQAQWAALGEIPEEILNELPEPPRSNIAIGRLLTFLSIYFTRCGPKKHLGMMAVMNEADFENKISYDSNEAAYRTVQFKPPLRRRRLPVENTFFSDAQIRAVEEISDHKGKWFLLADSNPQYQFENDIRDAYADQLQQVAKQSMLVYVDKKQELWGFKERQILGFVTAASELG